MKRKDLRSLVALIFTVVVLAGALAWFSREAVVPRFPSAPPRDDAKQTAVGQERIKASYVQLPMHFESTKGRRIARRRDL